LSNFIACGRTTDGQCLLRTSNAIRRADKGMNSETGLCVGVLITEYVVGTEVIVRGGVTEISGFCVDVCPEAFVTDGG